MVKLPDVSALGERPVVRPQRDIYPVRGATYVADALTQSGKALSDFAEQRAQEEDKLQTTYATAAFLKKQSEWLAQDDTDYATMSTRYEKDFGKIGDNGSFSPGGTLSEISKTIKNPAARKTFEANAATWVARGIESVNSKARTLRNDDGLAKLNEQFTGLSEAYQQATDPALKAKIVANFDALTDASKMFMGSNAEQQALALKKKFVEDNAKLSWAARPDVEKMDIIKKAQGGGQPLSVRNNNPGNLRDTKTGEFRVFNTPEEGKQAMQADLTAKITGNSPAMQAKYGKDYTPTLTSVISTWAPSTENNTQAYIDTVSKETGIAPDQPLTKEDVNKIMPAMIKVEGGGKATGYFGKTGTEFDFMSHEEKISEYRKTQEAIIKDDELRRNDPGFWGEKHGLSVEQRVSAQPDPFFASVIGKDEAKSNVALMNNFRSVNDVAVYANNLKNNYGVYSENALRDLKKAGMKPPFEAAISLTLQNPQAYKEHIELLSELGVSGEPAMNTLFKEKGYDSKKIDKLLTDETEEWGLMRSNEGMTLNEYSENIGVMKSLIQAKMVKDGTGDYDAALKFAMQPEIDNYNTAELNGVKYRVPKTDPYGARYDVDAIESRVASAYADMLPKIEEANKKKGFHLSDAIIPYLNREGDGLEFMTPIREPIVDKNGNRVVLKFDDVISNESRQERVDRIRKEMMALPYGERDAYREKAFGIKIGTDNVPTQAR